MGRSLEGTVARLEEHEDLPVKKRMVIAILVAIGAETLSAKPAGLDDTQTPTFVFRDPSWVDVRHHADFAVRCRMNGQNHGMQPRHGGSALRFVRYLGSAPMFDRLLPCAKWFAQHTEYFSHIEADVRVREDPVPIKTGEGRA